MLRLKLNHVSKRGRWCLTSDKPLSDLDDLVSWCMKASFGLGIHGCSFGISRDLVLTWHYGDVIMSTMASQITGVSVVCSTVYSGSEERKHQSSASLAIVRGIHQSPVNSPHKGPVTRKMFPFDDVIMGRRSHHYNRKQRVAGLPVSLE